MVTHEALHRHRSIRLRDYDYAHAGAYFITACTHARQCIFGEIIGGIMQLSDFGAAAQECWRAIPEHSPYVDLDAFIVMPNHVHGIVTITVGARHAVPLHNATSVPAAFGKPLAGSLATIVGSFKSATTKRVNELRGTPAAPVWQRNYHEHVIRNDRDLDRIRQYITENPVRWADDEFNPAVGAQHAAPLR